MTYDEALSGREAALRRVTRTLSRLEDILGAIPDEQRRVVENYIDAERDMTYWNVQVAFTRTSEEA